MTSRRSARAPVPSESPSIPLSLVRLVGSTARSAADGAWVIGGQLGQIVWRAAQGAQAASVAIGGDLASVARRAAAGTEQGIRELGRELTRMPSARARSRVIRAGPRPAAVRRRRPRKGTSAAQQGVDRSS